MHLDEYMKTIDVPKFEAILRELAAESPDFRYVVAVAGAADCRYNGPCLLYTSPSPRDGLLSRMPSSA